MAFLSPASHAVSNIIDSHFSNSLFKKVPTLVFYGCITNFIALPVLFFFGWPQAVPLHLIPLIFLSATLGFVYLFPYYMALKKVDTSIVAALFSLGKIILPVLAFFIVGEKLSNLQYFGFSIIILFNLILNIDNPRKIKINSGFWLMLLCSILVTVDAVICKKILMELDWVSTVFYITIIVNSFILSMLLVPKLRKDIVKHFGAYRKNFKLFILLEISDRFGSIPAVFALSILPVLVAESIFSVQPIFVLLFGVILYKIFGDKFKEDVSKNHVIKKIICFAFIILGVAMVIK